LAFILFSSFYDGKTGSSISIPGEPETGFAKSVTASPGWV